MSSDRRNHPSHSLHTQVVQELGRRIAAGAIAEGELLPNEETLTTNFEVSRTVIREAMKTLAAKGMVEARPKIGTRVRHKQEWNLLDPDILLWRQQTGPDPEFWEDFIDVRRVIEPAVARLAAQRATDAEIEAIGVAFAELAAAEFNRYAYIQADLKFHECIFAACHNKVLNQMVNTVWTILRASIEMTVQVPNALAESVQTHFEVYDAIRRRDGDGAFLAMERVVDKTSADIGLILQRAGVHRRAPVVH